jgi:hypothetical protein
MASTGNGILPNRTLVDPQFAAELEEATKKFDIPIDKLKEIAKTNRPPQWWYSCHDKKPW